MNKNSFKLTSRDYLVVLSMLYASVSLAMNVFCMKPLSWGTDVVFSDGGQTISWIVFLISNVIVEVWGEKESSHNHFPSFDHRKTLGHGSCPS